MTSRVIYSLYVDVPAEEHYGDSKNKHDTKEKANVTVNAFKEHYQKLVDCKQKYADSIGAEFKMYVDDSGYLYRYKHLKHEYPYLTGYELINFYKIFLLNTMSNHYDEILYLDFDTIPLTDESFFDAWDLSKGICVYSNNNHVDKKRTVNSSIRSPSAKYYNCQAMLLDGGYNPNNDVINTGIIGAKSEDIKKLDFFGKFDDTMKLMARLRTEKHDLYPQNIIDMFHYDNETIFSYKKEVNKVHIQWLDNKWHYFLDTQKFIPYDTKIVHAISKDFDLVWRRYD